MSLQSIETAFETAAAAEWKKIEGEGIIIAQEIKTDAVTVFSTLATQFAPLVMSIISNLATGELAKLSGDEKANLAATSLVEQAAQQGVQVLDADATGLVKLGFEHFKEAAPALGLPQNVTDAASKAIDTAEGAVEGAISGVAGKASAAIPQPSGG